MQSGRSCHVAFQPLVDGFNDPAVIVDGEHRILAANNLYRDAFANGDAVDGLRCYQVSHKRDRPCGQAGESCPLDHARATRIQARALHVHCRGHEAVHENVTVHPLIDDRGSITAYVERHRVMTAASASALPGKLVGRSAPFMRMLELVIRGAPSRSTILLLGESGTGKERVARVLHSLSDRASTPFVSVDCSGLTESLFESELFGHEKGAFTGAFARKRGLVEAAHGGTLFLDEVGDVPRAEQVKLLRLLETGIFRRVGGVDELRSDFRLICATNRNIDQMVETGSFRRDLFFRISAFPIHLPPLRERRDDIPVLVELFLKMASGEDPRRISDEALALLDSYAFPGNVRELHNLVERACLLSDDDLLLPEHFPDIHLDAASPAPAYPMSVVPLEEAERQYLQSVAARFQGSRYELAKVLGLSPRTLYRKLRGLRPTPVRPPTASVPDGIGAGVAAHVAQNRGGAGRNVPGIH